MQVGRDQNITPSTHFRGKALHINHVAIWTDRLEELVSFYSTYFCAVAGPRYDNKNKGFSSYFLYFASGARLELMSMPGIRPRFRSEAVQDGGLIHLAMSTGSKAAVDALTKRLISEGYTCLESAHHTGDGYYESTVLDPDGNRIEITV